MTDTEHNTGEQSLNKLADQPTPKIAKDAVLLCVQTMRCGRDQFSLLPKDDNLREWACKIVSTALGLFIYDTVTGGGVGCNDFYFCCQLSLDTKPRENSSNFETRIRIPSNSIPMGWHPIHPILAPRCYIHPQMALSYFLFCAPVNGLGWDWKPLLLSVCLSHFVTESVNSIYSLLPGHRSQTPWYFRSQDKDML